MNLDPPPNPPLNHINPPAVITFQSYDINTVNTVWEDTPSFLKKILLPIFRKHAIEYCLIRNKEKRIEELVAHRTAATIPSFLKFKINKVLSVFDDPIHKGNLLSTILTQEITTLTNKVTEDVREFQNRHEKTFNYLKSLDHIDFSGYTLDTRTTAFIKFFDYRTGIILTEFNIKKEKDEAAKAARKELYDGLMTEKNKPALITVGQLESLKKINQSPARNKKKNKKKESFPNGGPNRPSPPPKKKGHRKGEKQKAPKRRNGNN